MQCVVETGWTCDTAVPNVCSPIPGDGLTRGSEQCDDGIRAPGNRHTLNGDGCTTTMTLEVGWTCTNVLYPVTASPGSICVAICGDGIVVPTETCDDGAAASAISSDGCTAFVSAAPNTSGVGVQCRQEVYIGVE